MPETAAGVDDENSGGAGDVTTQVSPPLTDTADGPPDTPDPGLIFGSAAHTAVQSDEVNEREEVHEPEAEQWAIRTPPQTPKTPKALSPTTKTTGDSRDPLLVLEDYETTWWGDAGT